jgi:hypothetical protein
MTAMTLNAFIEEQRPTQYDRPARAIVFYRSLCHQIS